MNPIGTATSEITNVKVALNSKVRSSTVMFLGRSLVVEESIRRTLDEPKRNRMKVPNVKRSKFRLLCEIVVSADNLTRDQNLTLSDNI